MTARRRAATTGSRAAGGPGAYLDALRQARRSDIVVVLRKTFPVPLPLGADPTYVTAFFGPGGDTTSTSEPVNTASARAKAASTTSATSRCSRC